MYLRPHCEEEELQSGEECPLFTVESPDMLKTDALAIGDTLDMDIVIENPSQLSITRVRSWLTFDPTLLKGKEIEIEEGFIPTPNEDRFNNEEGYLELEVTADTDISSDKIVTARITFEVLKASPTGTSISFFNVQQDGNTAVYTDVAGEDMYALQSEPGTLHVLTSSTGTQTSSATQSSASSTSVQANSDSSLFGLGHACTQSSQCASQFCNNSVCSEQTGTTTSAGTSSAGTNSSPARTAFTLLQIQNVRVTTEGSNVFLAWDALASSTLQGYNVYYGSVSGEYVQRRSVDSATISMTLKGLPEGTRYFFAVRGVGAQNEESAYSQEVAVTVGDPSTSTAPLLPGTYTKPINENMPNVPGETGASSTIAIFLLISAAMGTTFAWRRQLSVAKAS